MKIGFIGAGHMGGAILKGLLASSPPQDIAVSEPKTGAWGLSSYHDNPRLVRESSLILICVKPFLMKQILEEIKGEAHPSKLFVSIAAGIPTKTIEAALGAVPVIRVMPNTPAAIGWGMSALSLGAYADERHLQRVQAIFNSVGKTVSVEEKHMDIVTAISGSGPAFFYYFIEAMVQAGSAAGLSPETALLLAAQTAAGAGQMLLQSDKSPQTLISEVTTPGGTTAAGLEILKPASSIIENTIAAAERRSRELGAHF